jgi:hypothetical protein
VTASIVYSKPTYLNSNSFYDVRFRHQKCGLLHNGLFCLVNHINVLCYPATQAVILYDGETKQVSVTSLT